MSRLRPGGQPEGVTRPTSDPLARQPRKGAVVLRALPEPSDEALVEKIRQGDAQAADWLCRRYAPHVTRILARILGSDPDLVDAAQEVLLRCVDEIGKLRDPKAFRAWVTALAVTQAKGVLRRRIRWRWLFGERLEADPLDDRDPESAEAVRAVYATLGKLNVEERTLFALRYLEGMELTEVAEAMGMSLATLKRRLVATHKRFAVHAAAHPSLERWLQGSRFDESGEERT